MPADLPDSIFARRGLGELLLERIASGAGRDALRVVGGESWSWERLATEASAIQRGLRNLGIAAGDHVALMGENSARMAALLCGITGCGAVAVPLNTSLVGEGLRHVLNDSDAKLVVADPPYLARCRQVQGPSLARDTPSVSTADSDDGRSWSRHFGREGDLQVRGCGADPALLLYTSGTTGRAKGVVLSHACALMAIEASAAEMFEAGRDDVLYTCLPLFHCAAQRLGFWTSLRSGATLVLAAAFSASTFWDQIRTFGVTKFHFIGPMASILWKAPRSSRDAAHPARLAVGGGPRLAYREFEERFGVTFVESYGMTETFGGCVSHRSGKGHPGAVGRGLTDVEVAVMDALGTRVQPGTEGEICIRPRFRHAVFSGYYKRPDLTEQAFRDGWFRTGDLGVMDGEGMLSYRARLKEIIRRRGENVSPVEVEEAIGRYPGIEECAVVGVPAEIGEEEILAVVVSSDAGIDIDGMLAFVRRSVPAFALPRFVAQAAALPKTSTGRVRRHELAASFLAQARDLGLPPGRCR